MSFFKRRPFLSFALAGLVLLAAVWATGARHDSGGVLTALYYLGAFFCLPFALAQLLVQPLAGGEATTPVAVMSVSGGFLACWLADEAAARFRRRRAKGEPSA